MDNPNIFRKLMSMLPQDSINTLLKSSIVFNERVADLEYDNYYWFLRIESDFDINIPIDEYNEEWYDVYNNIQENGLRYLFLSGNINLVKLGLLNGVDPSAYNNEALIFAVYYEMVDAVKLLLSDERVDPSDRKNEAFIIACTNGNEELVLLLLDDDCVNPADQRSKAVIQASKEGYANIVQIILIDGRADPSVSSNQSIKLASRQGHADVVRLLLKDSRVDPTADNNSALRLALKYDHKNTVDILLSDDRVINV